MEWLSNLFFGSGIAHSIFAFALVITFGVILGRLKIAGVGLGVSWVLFMGILAGHFGVSVEPQLLDFLKEFGLILFVYSIGSQVGPSFFSSFKESGIKMNAIAMIVVFTGVALCCVLHFTSGIQMSTMVGVLSGAVTNTPGLGAATQAYSDIKGVSDPSITLGYAVAYPMGVMGAILSMIFLRKIFKVNPSAELEATNDASQAGARRISIALKNPSILGKSIEYITTVSGRHFVISRVCHKDSDNIEIPQADTILSAGDKILVVCDSKDYDFITAFLGEPIEMEWRKMDTGLEARRIMITNPDVNGKTIGKLGLFGGFAFNITRVNRAGIDLVAHASLALQMGDRITIVGTEAAIKNVEKLLGNSMLRLRQPNLIPIFLGILLGVIFGSMPFFIPGIPQPVKLGLAGGPLVIAILLSRFGPNFKIVTYTTVSANLMMREIGIALFLAGVGLGAGQDFVSTIIDGGGYKWIGYGTIMTIVPILFAGFIGRVFFKMNFFTLTGILSGSTTNPPALAYANSAASNDMPAVGYATVYPLSMFMRVVSAQLLIIIFV